MDVFPQTVTNSAMLWHALIYVTRIVPPLHFPSWPFQTVAMVPARQLIELSQI